MRATFVTVLLALAALPVFTPSSAAASYDPLAGGSTKIVLAGSFRALLRHHGVRLLAEDGVRIHRGEVTFPVSGGRLDPVTGHGKVEHEGSLVFATGNHRLPLRELTLKTTQAHSPLAAKFGGGKLKLAASATLDNVRAGFGMRSEVGSMRLSAKVAERLDKKLHLRGVFGEGQLLGRSVTNVRPATVALLSSGRVEWAPDAAFLAKLRELFVSLNPIAPAELAPGTVLTLPITGGALAPSASTGMLDTDGELEFLQLGGGQIFWAESGLDFGVGVDSAEVDLEPVPTYPGELGRIGILDIGVGNGTPDPAARTISVAGATLTMEATTAAAFNEAFAKPQGRRDVFVSGEPMGSISFMARGH